jgi:hypothetical protein
MTINIAVKCPEGIVLGSDSLTTILDDNTGNIVSSIPFSSKLFSLGDSSKKDNNFAVGAMINGFNSIGGIRVEDIIEEFEEIYSNKVSSDEYSVADMAKELVNHIQHYINTILEQKRTVNLEIIIAGFSKSKKIVLQENVEQRSEHKYGEIYSYIWNDSRQSTPRIVSNRDGEFGTFYGGQPTMLDRFRFGIDDWIIYIMLERKNMLYDQVKYYIYKQLKNESKDIPDILNVKPPTNISEYNIFKLFSAAEPGKTIGETIKNIKENMKCKLETMERQFSLQAAVNYCIFLMSCAYAHSAFTFIIPVVGSEMRVASITRQEGFKFRKIWDLKMPGPPFI